jgi:hypothetical protein
VAAAAAAAALKATDAIYDRRFCFSSAQRPSAPAAAMPGYRQKLSQKKQGGNGARASVLQSALAACLLLLWASGELSAAALQKIALAAKLDGLILPEIAHLAALGAWGHYLGNVSRDLITFLEREFIGYAQPTLVQTKMLDPKTGQVEDAHASLFRPDEILAGLYKYEEFEAVMRPELVKEFWDSVRPDDPKLIILKAELGITCQEELYSYIPLAVHGDGVEFQSGDSLMTWHVSSVLSNLAPIDGGLMLAAMPKTCTCSETWGPMWDEMCAGFRICQVGEKDGEILAGGWKFVIWILEGDHEHFANVLKLPHWNCDLFCWECWGTKATGLSFQSGFPCCQPRTIEEEMANRLSVHPLFEIPGVSHFNVAQDAMHILFVHGILNSGMGSALKHWCYRDAFRGHSPAGKLAHIFQRIQTIYREVDAKTRLTNLYLNMFLDPTKPNSRYPTLKSKAGESKHLIVPFATLAVELSDNTQHDAHVEIFFAMAAKLCELIDACPMFPTNDQAAEFEQCMSTLLKSFEWLHDSTPDELTWHKQFKHHMAAHLAQNFKYMNCKYNWCFKGEDFVGKASILAHSCCFGVRATRLTIKLMKKYRILMHLKLTRLWQEG